jgi:hypothetical protein
MGFQSNMTFLIHTIWHAYMSLPVSYHANLIGFPCVFFPSRSDKELDVIEMAVYGDVIRPGKQCRCKTVAEMLGQVKPKNQMAACDLPYDDAS